jgi:CubicO group peptidase (beta-lactamase class C family)
MRSNLSRSAFPAAVLLSLALPAVTGCKPVTNAKGACWAGNLALTASKDAAAVGRYGAGIDAPMQDLMEVSGAPSCAIAVVGENRIATLNAYGDSFAMDGSLLDPMLPAVAQTRLYVGSIAKTITALAMLRLEEESTSRGGIGTGPRVSLLDRPLVDLYPPVAEVPEWASFTPRQLLAHATGIPKNPNPSEDDALEDLPAAAGPFPGIHPRHAFVVYRNTMPRIAGFVAGYSARYSNIGYSLVGAAIDWQTALPDVAGSASGYERWTFEQVALADDQLGEPTMLSMCLGTPWRAPQMDNLAKGFASGSKVPLDAPNYSGWEGPAGGWTMTIGDLGRLIVAIHTDARISAASRAEMFASLSQDGVSEPNTWCLGVWRSIDGHDLRWGKGGDIDGFTSDLIAYRDAGVGAAIVCNQSDVSHDALRDTIRTIIDPCRYEAPEDRPAYCSPPSDPR